MSGAAGPPFPRALVPGALLVLVLALGVASLSGDVTEAEAAFLKACAFREGRTPAPLIAVTQGLTWLFDAAQRTVLTVVVAAILLWQRRGVAALVMIVAVPVAGALSSLLKEAFARARPEAVPHLDLVESLSYPSGHAVNAMATLLLAALLLARSRRRLWIAAALAGALVVGATRVLLGVHYPSDVLGGWMLGAAAALLAARHVAGREALSGQAPAGRPAVSRGRSPSPLADWDESRPAAEAPDSPPPRA